MQVTATIRQYTNAVHVLYWIGLEATQGTVLTNAVRVASEASQFAQCGEELHDGTAISLERAPGLAEVTLRIRPQDRSFMENASDEKAGSPCVWSGVLRWKAGSGFRIRKLAENCKESAADAKINDEGQISLAASPQK
jgi:hypothetical protein